MNGNFAPCCKNNYSFGNWVVSGVAASWHSPQARAMREEIAAGRFPNDQCRVCWSNGTATSLRKMLNMPLQGMARVVKLHNDHGIGRLGALRDLFDKTELDTDAAAILKHYFEVLGQHRAVQDRFPAEFAVAVQKLSAIGEIARDFLSAEPEPKNVAPLRQTNVVATCNARCIHCPGMFTEEIIRGVHMAKRGLTFTHMSAEDLEKSLEAPEGIIDFFANGSELLFFKEWESLAQRLAKEGVRLRVSSNGMLLTPKNVRALIDNGYISKLNVSLDAASPALLEEIRGRVKYDRVRENLAYFFDYVAEKGQTIHVSFSFVLMKRNYHELPDFVDLVSEIKGDNTAVNVSIVVQGMSLKGRENYGAFLAEEHHSLVPREALAAKVEEMAARAKAKDIPVAMFYSWPIERFIELGCPFPRLDFVPVKTSMAEAEEA